MRAAFAVLLLAPALAGCASAPRACEGPLVQPSQGGGEEAIGFRSGDGVLLGGSWWPGDPAHVVVLVHGLNEDRRAWQPLVEALRPRGFTVLAFDLRGHGASTNRSGEEVTARDLTAHDFQQMELDVAAAVEVARGRVAPPCIAVVGASLGANLALRSGVAKPGIVNAVAMLSPGLDYRGVTSEDALASWRGALFLAAAQADGYASESAHRLASLAEGEVHLQVAGNLHGTDLLAASEVKARLVDWLTQSV